MSYSPAGLKSGDKGSHLLGWMVGPDLGLRAGSRDVCSVAGGRGLEG